MIKNEIDAANESITSGLYVIWAPLPTCILTSAASDEIRNGIGQCCRVGTNSSCICGHLLQNHKQVVPSRSGGYNKPPTCLNCKKCKGFNYAPSHPEEVGQIWLKSRKDFNLSEWRQRVREKPHDYACIGCEQTVSDHETIFEIRSTRVHRGAGVDDSYFPVSATSFPVSASASASASATNLDSSNSTGAGIGIGNAKSSSSGAIFLPATSKISK